ncbi:MAG: hypothetical protein PHI06_12005 [Desulfobulbaceae bacterium]|nr:hypothetical protein [Desulfobulbaceae bacterium]
MVVYEIKDPAAVVTASLPKPLRKDISPTLAVQHVQAIGDLLARRDSREKGGRQGRHMVPLEQASVREICRLLEEINQQLERQGAMIHLLLVADDRGFAIDLYDCSDGNVCQIIHDISLGVDDLPLLLSRLTQKVGIMVDTVS